MCKPGNYSGVAPERCLKISTAILSACRCLSNDDISNSIRAIAAINPPSTTGGSLLGLAGNSSGAAAGTAGSPAAPAPAAVVLRYCLDHLRNDQMLTPSSLARSFANTPPVCNRCTAATLKFSSLLSKKRSKKELTKRPPFLVKSLVCKSSEKTVNGGWRDGRTLEPFSQALLLVNRHQFARRVKECCAEKAAKGFSCWSQFVAMMFCQLAQAKSLREISDGLACCEGKLKHLGLEEGPKRSTLSYANARRPWQLFESLFYDQLALAQSLAPKKKLRLHSSINFRM